MARDAELILEVELVDANGSGFSRFSSLLTDICIFAQLERREGVPVVALVPETERGYRRRVVFAYVEAMDGAGADDDPARLAESFMGEKARGGSVRYTLSKGVPYASSDDLVA